MENLNPNLTPTPAPISASAQPIRKYMRTIALSLAGLIIAGGFLAYTGGFNSLSKIFKSKAGTEILFAGFDNLQGNENADNFVKGDLMPAIFGGTSAFTGFSGVPDDPISGKSVAGFVAPIFSNLDLTLDTFVNHTYISPAIDLGTASTNLTQITAYLYLASDTDETTVAYRTSDDMNKLQMTSFVTLNDTPAIFPANESLKTITSEVPAGTFSQYLQLKVDFVKFSSAQRTAFYGVALDSATESTGDMGVSSAPAQRTITMTYTTTNAPAAAEIKIFGSDPSALALVTKTGVNLSAAAEYTFETELATGAYALVITSPVTATKTLAFEVHSGSIISIPLGNFIAGLGKADGGGGSSADLNGDGVVNPFDAAILFDQLGSSNPLTE